MQLISYLTFNGQCEAAFQFYARCLGGKIETMLPHAGTPAEQHVPAAWRNKIMHARLTANGATLLGSDAQPEHYQPPKGIAVTLEVKDPVEAERPIVMGPKSDSPGPPAVCRDSWTSADQAIED